MSTITSSGAFATFKANNAHLYSSSQRAFDINRHNKFMKLRSPKAPRSLSEQKLSNSQKQSIRAKIKAYAASEKRNAIISASITALASAGILILSSQILNNLF